MRILGLFPSEKVFLDKVCENMTHDFKLKNVLVSIFKMEEKDGEMLYCEDIYHKILADNPEAVDMEAYLEIAKLFVVTLGGNSSNSAAKMPDLNYYIGRDLHILTYLDCEGEGRMFGIDVCAFKQKNKQDLFNLTTGIISTLVLLRGGSYKSSSFSVSKDGAKAEMPVTTGWVIKAVDQWMKDDEDYQSWKEISEPYIDGYFEEPDLRNMGIDMISSIKDAVVKCVTESNRAGLLNIGVVLYGDVLRGIFGSFGKDSVLTKANLEFEIGPKKLAINNGRRKYEIRYAFVDDSDPKNQKPLVDFDIVIGVSNEIELEKCEVAIRKGISDYLQIWQAVTLIKSYIIKVEILK